MMVRDKLRGLPGRFRKSIRRRGMMGTLGLIVWKTGSFFGDWLLPSRYRARRLDSEFDARFGVDTRGAIMLSELQIRSDNLQQGNEYEQTKPADFARLIKRLKIRHEDFIFVDLGSGKGRALLLASDYPFKKIVGVEFAAELHQVSQENIRKYRNPSQKCGNFELLLSDAAHYAIPNENEVFYIYNSFREELMAKVLSNVKQSLAEYPREVFIIYCNAVHRDLVSKFDFTVVEMNRWHAIYKSEAAAKLEIAQAALR